MAAVNPFRFSTKYHDDPAGLVYFGYRTYKPETGRWLNRDPIGEMGGVNLYQFSRNNGPNLIDPTGLQSWMLWQVETGVWAAMHAEDLAGWYQRSDVFSAQVGLSESLAGLGLDAAAMQEMFSGQTAVNLLYGGSMTPCADLARGWFQGKVLSITSSFTPRQGEFYAWTGFAGEVAPALIPFGGWEGQAGRSGSQIMMLLGRRAPRLLRFANTDLAKAFSKLTEKGLQSCESEIGMAAKTEATVFRQGTFADETIGWEGNYVKGRQWATDNPLTTPNYAQKYGLPAENTGNPDWVVGGRTQGPYSTRPAPASHNNPLNPGGATEVLPQNPNDVRLDWFHMPD